MKQLVIISGKGGTGKTVISASLATLAQNKVIVDCDVDAANLHLLLHPQFLEIHDFWSGMKARIDPLKCTQCRECLKVCRFAAIEDKESREIIIDPISCEGCSVCSLICPTEAIAMEQSLSGKLYVSRTKHGPFIHARLGIGEENSGKLVAEVRKKANEIADQNSLSLIIIDGPPGIGCPVISSLSGTDLALIVSEPTLSGIQDMERVAQTARHFQTQTACCINKHDLNLENTRLIENWCQKNSIPLVGKIPYDEEVVKSMVKLIPVTEYSNHRVSKAIKKIWEKLKKIISIKETER